MNELQYNELKKAISDFEEVFKKYSNKEIAYTLNKNMHPYYLDNLGRSILMAVAEFKGYYPLLICNIPDLEKYFYFDLEKYVKITPPSIEESKRFYETQKQKQRDKEEEV